jgi:hypothetical protein
MDSAMGGLARRGRRSGRGQGRQLQQTAQRARGDVIRVGAAIGPHLYVAVKPLQLLQLEVTTSHAAAEGAVLALFLGVDAAWQQRWACWAGSTHGKPRIWQRQAQGRHGGGAQAQQVGSMIWRPTQRISSMTQALGHSAVRRTMQAHR